MNKLALRIKILLMVVPGLLFSIILGGILINETHTEKLEAESLTKSAVAQSQLSSLIHNLQKERGSSGLFINNKITLEQLKEIHAKSDLEFDSFAKSIEKVKFSDSESSINSMKQNLLKVRQELLSSNQLAPAFKAYSQIINEGIRLELRLFENAQFKGVEAKFLSLTIFEESKENMGKLRASLTNTFSSNSKKEISDRDQYAKYLAAILINIESPGLNISKEGKDRVLMLLKSSEWESILQSYNVFSEKYSVGDYGIDAKLFFENVSKKIDEVNEVINSEHTLNLDLLKKESLKANKTFLIISTSLIIFILGLSFFTLMTLKKLINDFRVLGKILGETSQNVRESALQVAQASEALSQTTTEQAASLQETSASIEEISSMVSANTENAKQSAVVSDKSLITAEKGKGIVENMIVAINEISQSNSGISVQMDSTNNEIEKILTLINEIGNKTNVINDIVFQTKLLSFNASVEAARAGEHGKGFAVVAEEVGNLAAMSGKAALEIQSMLDGSIKTVEDIVKNSKNKIGIMVSDSKLKINTGTLAAKECQEVLNEIVNSVAAVSSLASEISKASQEQAQGVHEITKAIAQLDQVTHQNTASTVDSANVASGLSAESEKLNQLVNQLIQTIDGKS